MATAQWSETAGEGSSRQRALQNSVHIFHHDIVQDFDAQISYVQVLASNPVSPAQSLRLPVKTTEDGVSEDGSFLKISTVFSPNFIEFQTNYSLSFFWRKGKSAQKLTDTKTIPIQGSK